MPVVIRGHLQKPDNAVVSTSLDCLSLLELPMIVVVQRRCITFVLAMEIEHAIAGKRLLNLKSWAGRFSRVNVEHIRSLLPHSED